MTRKKEVHRRQQLQQLRDYLHISDIPENYQKELENEQLAGTCQWFTQKGKFQAWLDGSHEVSENYWLNAPQASGKTILAAHVVRNIVEKRARCSYHFFNHAEPGKADIGACLKSLAYQMASADYLILERLLALRDDSVCFDEEDGVSTWKKLFSDCIFETGTAKAHFWVIDALNECDDQSLIRLIVNRHYSSFPLRVFMTSRPNTQIVDIFSKTHCPVYADEMTVDDIRKDIELYIHSEMNKLPLQSQVLRQKLSEIILQSSSSSFLRTTSALKRMCSAFTESGDFRIVKEVVHPFGRLHKRALKLMSQKNRTKYFKRMVMLWAMCAIRLSTVVFRQTRASTKVRRHKEGVRLRVVYYFRVREDWAYE